MMFKLLGLSMMLILSGCCHKPPVQEPEIVVIKEGSIVKLDDGSYKVSKEWFLYRMDIEQRLKTKLIECKESR